MAAEIDPYHERHGALSAKYNTEACEQAFSWLDRFTPYLMEMGPGLFAAHLTMMMDRRNAHVIKKREKSRPTEETFIDVEVLRQARAVQFHQLREREIKDELCFLRPA